MSLFCILTVISTIPLLGIYSTVMSIIYTVSSIADPPLPGSDVVIFTVMSTSIADTPLPGSDVVIIL